MQQDKFKIVSVLAIVVILLSAAASFSGLFLNIYIDPDDIVAAWFGNDLVTLFLVVPASLIILDLARRKKISRILLAGIFSYYLYNYCFYLFGANFNNIFPLYILIVTASFYALILIFLELDHQLVIQHFEHGKNKICSILLLSMALPLAIAESAMIYTAIRDDSFPDAPPLVFALDFTMVIPAMILGAILLWQRKSWGYIIAVIMFVKAITYGTVLVAGALSIAHFSFYEIADSLFPFYVFVIIASIAGLALLFITNRAIK